MLCEMTPNYNLSDVERDNLSAALSSISADPYRQYQAFVYQVDQLVEKKSVSAGLVEVLQEFASGNKVEKPFIFVRNMPIDQEVPDFDNHRPVYAKYELKKTFVAEAMLTIIANLTDQTPIGYLNVNGGDVFQDIYPSKSMRNTQSQKALGPIYFHKDLANHYVRPDYVNMLAMRCSPENDIFTTFVKNIDLIMS